MIVLCWEPSSGWDVPGAAGSGWNGCGLAGSLSEGGFSSFNGLVGVFLCGE